MTMPTIETLVGQPAAQAVGWALLQFVWQGALIGAIAALALTALRRSAADVRYIVASIALALMLTLPVVTGVQRYQALSAQAAVSPAATLLQDEPAAVRSTTAPPAGRIELPAPTLTSSAKGRVADGITSLGIERMLPTMMLVWIAGVVLLSLRLLTGWLWVQRLRTHGVTPADDTMRRLGARIARRLHISRAVTLLESTLVDVPTVIGFLKPVVLLPASALAGLTAQQLEAILAHELAHIRRHDYVVNLLQTLVETVLFYHPAVWWVSRRIRVERENCCDDLAVSLCGDPVAYATALADLEALRSGPAPDHHIAMAATGGSLLLRVRRLLGAPASHTGRGPAWLAGSVALVLIGGIALGADGLRQESASAQQSKLEAVPVPAAPPAPPAPPAPFAPQAHPALPAPAAPVAPPAPPSPPAESFRDVFDSVPPAPPAAPASPAVPAPPAPPAPPAAVVSAPPAPPATPASPAPPAPPAAPRDSQSISHSVNDDNGTWSWSHNGDKLDVKYSGKFEFTDDDTDVRQISPGGSLKITDGNWIGRHAVEIRERNGQLERHYYVNASERPYEPEGRVWLQQNLPKFIRETGFGAAGRVARFLKAGGIPAVTAEISRIGSSYAKGIYYRELFKQATLTPEQYRQIMTQASSEMQSDYELAQLLIAVADKLPNDETSRAAYFTAASRIDSDYELRRVYSTMLRKGPVSSTILAGILEHSSTIDSDYELSELLRQILAQQTLDDRNRPAFFRAAGTISSDYERHRVLSAVIGPRQGPIDQASLDAALTHAASMNSDYEAATFLLELLRQNSIEGPSRAGFFKAAGNIDSNYERGRVLQEVAKKPSASDETLLDVLRLAKSMSGYELSQVLQTVARSRTLTGNVRESYLDVADRLSGYEQTQVLSALVRSERRK